MIKIAPAKNLLSIRLGADLPLCAASLYASNLAVTKVAMNVTQFTIGTAIDRSDLATRKLLNTDAP